MMMDEDAGRAALKMHLVTCLKCLNQVPKLNR